MTRPGETLPCPNPGCEGGYIETPDPSGNVAFNRIDACPMCDGHGEYDPTEWRYQ